MTKKRVNGKALNDAASVLKTGNSTTTAEDFEEDNKLEADSLQQTEDNGSKPAAVKTEESKDEEVKTEEVSESNLNRNIAISFAVLTVGLGLGLAYDYFVNKDKRYFFN